MIHDFPAVQNLKKVYCKNCECYLPSKYDKGGWAMCSLGAKCYTNNKSGFCKYYKRKWYKFWVKDE